MNFEHTQYLSKKYLDKLLAAEEVAGILAVKPATLAVWRSTKRYNLPFIKVGRLVRYRWADIMAFIEGRTHGNVDD